MKIVKKIIISILILKYSKTPLIRITKVTINLRNIRNILQIKIISKRNINYLIIIHNIRIVYRNDFVKFI